MIEHKEAAAKEFAQFQQQFFQTLQAELKTSPSHTHTRRFKMAGIYCPKASIYLENFGNIVRHSTLITENNIPLCLGEMMLALLG